MGGSAQYDVRTDGRTFAVSVHHHLGEKWSRVFESFMSEAFKNSLGITPHFDLTDNDVIMKFTAP
jgi:hypothetical protein